MTISELGSLAEIIGSIAVIITLVILVYQVRGARLELSSQITREIKRDNNDAFHQLIQTPDLIDIHIRGQREYNNLSEAEKITWLVWLFTWINQTEDAWTARNRGILDMEWVDAYMEGVARVLRSEGGRIAWPKLRNNFESPFAVALDRTIRESEETFLDSVLTADEPGK